MAMNAKTVAEMRFDAILRRMLQAKPLSRSEISAKLQVRRKARVQLPWQDQLALLRYTFRSFLRSPGNFLLPPLNQAQNPDLG